MARGYGEPVLMPIIVQIDAYDPVTAGPVTLRMASDDDTAVCHLNGQVWWPVLDRLPVLAMDFFGGEFGQVTTAAASLSLAVEPWPDFARYAFPDARLQIWHGDAGAAWAGYTLRFDGRVTSQPVIEDGRAQVGFAVDDKWLDTPMLATYAGTGGVEGPAAMKGTVKPLAIGAPMGVPGVMLDPIKSILQLSAYGAIESVDVPLERLARQFGSPFADYATYAALDAAAVPAGQWATAKAVGLVKMGAPPYGKLCFLMKGDKGGVDGWVRRPGAIIKRYAGLSGGAAKVSEAAVDALDAARPYDLSVYYDGQVTAREAIQEIAASVNAVAGVSLTGQLIVVPIQINATGLTLRADGSSLPIVGSVRALGISAPWWRLAIGAQPFFDVHGQGEYATDTTPETGATVGAVIGDNLRKFDDSVPVQSLIITPEGTAAAIAGQGALATANQAAYGSQISGLPGAIQPGNILSGGYLNAGQVQYGPGGPLVVTLQPAQAGADVTGTNVAAAITGQAPAATDATIQAGATNDTGSDTRAVDSPPLHYRQNWLRRLRTEFKDRTTIGSPAGATGPHGTLESYSAWADQSGGPVWQRFTDDSGRRFIRYSTGTTPIETWLGWEPEYSGNRKPFFGTDLLETSGGNVATLANFKTPLGTSAAIAGQGAFATVNTAAYGSGLLTGFGTLAPRSTVLAGSHLRNGADTVFLGDVDIITPQGVAAAVAGQADWATYSGISTANMAGRVSALDTGGNLSALDKVTNRRMTLLKRADGATDLTEAASITALGTAAAIAGQGVLATRSNVDDAQLGSVLSVRLGPHPLNSNFLSAATVAYVDGQWVQNLRPGEANANVTESRVAAAIAGQADWATYSGRSTTDVNGRLGFLEADGRMRLGVGKGLVDEGNNLWLTNALVVTNLGTSAAIVGQAATATSSDFSVLTGATKPQNNATNDRFLDTRNTNQPPSWYLANYNVRTAYEFKDSSALGVPGGGAFVFGALTTQNDYPDFSGGEIKQRFVYGIGSLTGAAYVRTGSGATWGAWAKDFSGFLRPEFTGNDLLESAGVVATLPNFKTPLGTAAAISGQAATATSSDYAVITGSTKPEANADVTITAQVTPVKPDDVTINADYLGAILPNQFNKTLLPGLTRGGVSVRGDNRSSFTLSNITGGLVGFVSVDSTNGSATKGAYTVTNCPSSGTFQMNIFWDGVLVASYVIRFTVTAANPPLGGGGSGGTKSGSVAIGGQTVSSTSFVSIAQINNLTKAAGETIKCNLPAADYELTHTTSSSRNVIAKFQLSPTGANSWTDVGTQVSGTSSSWVQADVSTSPGSITVYQTVAPSNGAFDIRLVVARNASGGGNLNFTSGIMSVSIEP